MEKLLAAGKTRTEALRLLRRQLSNVVSRTLLADEQHTTQTATSPADTAAVPVLPRAA